MPHILELYALDMPAQRLRLRLREEFYKNGHVRDPRVIDMLVIKACAHVLEVINAAGLVSLLEWLFTLYI